MKTTKQTGRPCVGCGHITDRRCPQCRKPTCGRKVGMCGHALGICARCVQERLRALFS